MGWFEPFIDALEILFEIRLCKALWCNTFLEYTVYFWSYKCTFFLLVIYYEIMENVSYLSANKWFLS